MLKSLRAIIIQRYMPFDHKIELAWNDLIVYAQQKDLDGVFRMVKYLMKLKKLQIIQYDKSK